MADAAAVTREARPPDSPAPRHDLASLAAAFVTVTLWGSSFVAIRDAGQSLSPGSLALGRLLVSLLVLGVVTWIRREPLPRRRDLPRIATARSSSHAGLGIALLIFAALAYATAVVIHKPVLPAHLGRRPFRLVAE